MYGFTQSTGVLVGVCANSTADARSKRTTVSGVLSFAIFSVRKQFEWKERFGTAKSRVAVHTRMKICFRYIAQAPRRNTKTKQMLHARDARYGSLPSGSKNLPYRIDLR